MKTLSSIVTPSQMNVWLEILQRRPTVAFFWISTNAPILVSSPISQPYRLMNVESLTSLPSFTSGAMDRCGFIGSSGCALAHDDGGRGGEQDLHVGPQRSPSRVTEI